jgi:hypothetical protein
MAARTIVICLPFDGEDNFAAKYRAVHGFRVLPRCRRAQQGNGGFKRFAGFSPCALAWALRHIIMLSLDPRTRHDVSGGRIPSIDGSFKT